MRKNTHIRSENSRTLFDLSNICRGLGGSLNFDHWTKRACHSMDGSASGVGNYLVRGFLYTPRDERLYLSQLGVVQ